jgi:hypothetical protein
MSLCAACGFPLTDDSALCSHHHAIYGDDWAEANRIMCNFLHRGKVPPRLGPAEREDEPWPAGQVV